MSVKKGNISSGERFVRSFFEALNDENISYCVVGSNADQLPIVPDNDIDIVFLNNKILHALNLIHLLSKRAGAKVAQQLWHERGAYYSVVCVDEKNGVNYIKLDICGDYIRRCKFFLMAQWLLEGRRRIRGHGVDIFVAAPEREFEYYILKKIDKGYIDKVALCHLSNLYSERKNACIDVLKKYWGNEFAIDMENALANKDHAYFDVQVRSLQKILRANLASPSKGLIFSEWCRRLTRIIKPSGMVVVVLGPDGSGKSTLLAQLVPRCAPLGRKNAQYHLWPRISAKHKAVKVVTDPHRLEPRSVFSSVIKLLYLAFRYNLGWLKWVFWPYRRSTMIWFDRYYHDILADPLRYRMGAPASLVRLVGKFIPKPDLFLVLDVAPEVARSRKTEVSEAESQRQFHAYRALAEELFNAVLIDANGTPEEVTAACERALVEAMVKRLEKRNQGFVAGGCVA